MSPIKSKSYPSPQHDLHLEEVLYNSKNPTRRWLHHSRYNWICKTIAQYATPSLSTILEIGVGSGTYLPTLLSFTKNIVVSDIEKSYLNHASKKYSHTPITFTLDDITHSNFANNTFDLILCSEVIEHIKESQKAFFEINRILKPNGILILTTPQKHCLLEQLVKLVLSTPGMKTLVEFIYKEPIPNDMGHVNLMTEKEIYRQSNYVGLFLLEKYKSGMYFPIIAEFMGEFGLNILKVWEQKIKNSCWNWLLWTQYYVLKKN